MVGGFSKGNPIPQKWRQTNTAEGCMNHQLPRCHRRVLKICSGTPWAKHIQMCTPWVFVDDDQDFFDGKNIDKPSSFQGTWMVFCFDQPKKKVTHIHRPTWRKIRFRIFGLLGEGCTKIFFTSIIGEDVRTFDEHIVQMGLVQPPTCKVFFFGGGLTKKLGWEAMWPSHGIRQSSLPSRLGFLLWFGACLFQPWRMENHHWF